MNFDDRPDAAKRLEEARELRGHKNPKDAARFHGWVYETYIQHEQGTRGISRAAGKYAEAFKVSKAWLLTGEGEPRPGKASTVVPAGEVIGTNVPFAGKVQAGRFVEVDLYDQSYETEEYPTTPLPDTRFPRAKQFAWLVVGNSMDQENILDGMMVLGADYHDYSETYSEVKDGDLVIVERARNGGQEIERTVKRIRFFIDRFELHPNSSNPEHKPISVFREQKKDNGEEVRLLAVVLSAHTILLR